MPTTYLTHGYETETMQIVVDVFSSMLRMDAQQVDAPGEPNQPVITASVRFTGSWRGALRIECIPEQTFEFARRLLNIELPAEVNEDVCDAYGELANMIGGNLKAVLPPAVQLSMPLVVRDGVDHTMDDFQSVTACRLAFLCELGVFWVTLVEFV